ncbi:M50 family metallopeptidase [Desertibacillus haloalkaliphilus]|uniref:M50 family metallopeptidase n=1 Tax=Desertibacillus haloalkaliphilus TaxID=1328930 RepID=UPI001C268CAA|nr:M50 family metallopeptidase [Desertibacillus haloalkaliphilus]MBU8905026.1 M50 family metallopeptidase [Desertibacillus haloalkaliphilus]
MTSFFDLFNKIKINPFFWFVIGIGILTGYFREVLMVFTIVFIHEMGHSIAAHFFKWKITKIELLPFGGVAEMDEHGNRPLYQEFIIIIAGPLQHLWLILLSFACLQFDFWTVNDHEIFVAHNVMILLFNLLPVWPLDGGRLVLLLCSMKWPFQVAQKRALIFSFISLFVVSITSIYLYPFHLNLWVVLTFLYASHYLQWRQRNYYFMRFLMERFYRPQLIPLARRKIIVQEDTRIRDVVQQFRRGFSHTIIVTLLADQQRKQYDEKEILRVFFEGNNMYSTMKEALRLIS